MNELTLRDAPAGVAPEARASGWACGRTARDAHRLLALALPIVAGLAASASMGVVDSLVLGGLGAVPLAAVSLTSSVALVFYAGLYGLLTPVGLLAARARGANDPHAVATHRVAGVRLAAAAGALAALAMAALWPLLPFVHAPPDVLHVMGPYLACNAAALVGYAVAIAHKQWFDALDHAWWGVALALFTVAVNAVASATLVHGIGPLPALGLTGAGLGTLIAHMLGAVAHGVVARRARAFRAWQMTGAPNMRSALRAQRREGTPMGLQYVAECGANAAAGIMIGVFGATALAANQIAGSVSLVLYMAPLGLAAAVGLQISHAAGAGESQRLWPIARTGLALTTAWMLLVGLTLVLVARPLASAFTPDLAVIAHAVPLIAALAAMQLADGVQSVSLGALRGLLDNRWPTIVSLVGYWGVALPMAWGLSVGAGIGAPGVWLGFGLGIGVAAALLVRRLRQRLGVDSEAV